jgi:hypothetical protein
MAMSDMKFDLVQRALENVLSASQNSSAIAEAISDEMANHSWKQVADVFVDVVTGP